jgi:hypothetical protein
VGQLRLHASTRPFEAQWLSPRLAFGSGVASIVPDGFPAYFRILHPAHGMTGERLRWAEVAAKSGRTMHRLVQFHAINPRPVSGSEVAVDTPDAGNLPSDLLRVACAALAEHTSTPDSCSFCLWDGYGWQNNTGASSEVFTPTGMIAVPASTLNDTEDSASRSRLVPADVLNAPRVSFHCREYFLLEGPLEAAAELGWNFPGGVFVRNHRIYSGQTTTPGASRRKSICSAPWSPVRTPWLRACWLIRVLRFCVCSPTIL